MKTVFFAAPFALFLMGSAAHAADSGTPTASSGGGKTSKVFQCARDTEIKIMSSSCEKTQQMGHLPGCSAYYGGVDEQVTHRTRQPLLVTATETQIKPYKQGMLLMSLEYECKDDGSLALVKCTCSPSDQNFLEGPAPAAEPEIHQALPIARLQ